MAGSLQIKNGIYQAVFYIQGQKNPIWRSTGIKAQRGNKRKAEQRMIEIITEYQTDIPHSEDVLFIDYIKQWLKVVAEQVDIITLTSYEQYVDKHIIPFYKPLNLKLKDVTTSDIEKYYRYKSKTGRLDGKSGGLSRSSIKRHSVVLNSTFEEGIRNGFISTNPCKYAKIPKQQEKEIIQKLQFYTVLQCEKLLEVTYGTILHDMIYTTFIYGLRRSELLGMRWCDIDFENNTITIQHTRVVNGHVSVAKNKTKNKSSNRTYPLLDDIKDILLKIKKRQSEYKQIFGDCYIDSEYVFTKEDGSTYYPSYPTHALEKILDKHTLPHIRWHDLRHSCASLLLLKGWSMKDISEWLGHSQIGVTMNLYAHIDLDYKRTLSKDLNGLFDKNKDN